MTKSVSSDIGALGLERPGQQDSSSHASEVERDATFSGIDHKTSTTTSVVTEDAVWKSVEQDTDAPLVDIALASARDSMAAEASVSPDDELASLRAEVIRLNETISEVGSASVRVLRARGEDALEGARARIRDKPVRAVALATLAGFLFGYVR